MTKINYAARFEEYVSSERVDYELLSRYTTTASKVLMRHKTCGHEWLVTPHAFKSRSSRCPKCSLIRDNSAYAIKFYEYVQSKRPTYEVLEPYINNSTKVLIKHKTCGYQWRVTPNQFKDTNSSCPQCTGKLKLSTEDLKTWISINRPEYRLLGTYVNTDTKVLMEHKVCLHTWYVTPHDFKSKSSSCPKCSKNNYSKSSIAWLTNISNILNIDIQHAENRGEYRLPELGYKVDGFSHETNTVFEFHGAAYHGGYDRSKDTLISAIPSKDPEELFYNTVIRMNKIIAKGYRLFYVFDTEVTKDYIGDYY